MTVETRKIKGYGYRSDGKDIRDKLWLPDLSALPPAVDLRPHCPPILTQGDLGSCTAHGITEALRYIIIKSGHPDRPLARLQLYYDERAIEGTVDADSGAEIRDGIKCAVSIGIAHENLWPYDVLRFNHKAPDNVYTDAHKFEAITYQRVQVDTRHLKAALATGYPVVIGFSCYESLETDQVVRSGVIPVPRQSEKMIGGHCVLAVGYGQKPGYFTIQNSWGTTWGDRGYGYMGEEYLGNSDLCDDYWRITRTT